MITIQTDEEVHELDVELIEVFAMALIDRDKDTMNDDVHSRRPYG